MKTATRFPLLRLGVIDREIRDRRYPNANSLGRLLEVSPRTIQRDIEFARDRLHAPLEFDSRRNGYYYTEPNYKLPTISLTEGELVAIFVAEAALRRYQGTPFGGDLRRAYAKIEASLSDQITLDLSQVGQIYSFRSPPADDCDPVLFARLATAIENRRVISITYQSLDSSSASGRVVEPYHLSNIEGRWYLLAHCRLRNDMRTFCLARISDCVVETEEFTRPDDFRVDDYLAGSLGVFCGKPSESHEVRIRFTGIAARVATERSWHPSQTLTHNDDGSVILCLTLNHLQDAKRFALQWGREAEVIAPQELRDSLIAELKSATGNYSAPPSRSRATPVEPSRLDERSKEPPKPGRGKNQKRP